MNFNSDIHKRKSIRLKDYDYSSEWLYFITISIKDKLCLFWDIKDNELNLFDSGKMIEKYWLELENKFDNIKLHDFVVMPNHFHWIIEIKNIQNNRRGEPCVRPDYNDNYRMDNKNNDDTNKRVNTRFTPTWWKFIYDKKSISWIIQYFKSKTTLEYIKNVKNNNWLNFNKKLWQRDYFEHIIRSEKTYLEIVNYIRNNPIKWEEDKFYNLEI